MRCAISCLLTGFVLALSPASAGAHCDTMDGPVVADAKAALAKGDVAPALKWVSPADEGQITSAFTKTLAVRAKGADARELADMYFFETLVRVHRAGEGAPYAGLKPTGTDPGPAVAAADKSLKDGSPDAVSKLVSDRVADGIRERFAKVVEARRHANDSVEAGRHFVAAYVQFTHYVENLVAAATAEQGEHHGSGEHRPTTAPAAPQHHHE